MKRISKNFGLRARNFSKVKIRFLVKITKSDGSHDTDFCFVLLSYLVYGKRPTVSPMTNLHILRNAQSSVDVRKRFRSFGR